MTEEHSTPDGGDEPTHDDGDTGFPFDDDRPSIEDDRPTPDDGQADDADEGRVDDADEPSVDEDEPVVTEAEPGRDGGDGEPPESDDNGSENRVRRYVLWVALAVLGLFSVVLLFQFYGSTMQAITDWVGPEYRSVVRSAVSLVLLCLTLIGIARVTRELTA